FDPGAGTHYGILVLDDEAGPVGAFSLAKTGSDNSASLSGISRITGAPNAVASSDLVPLSQLQSIANAPAAAVVAAALATLDTLDELAAALGDDANFATTVTSALAGKAASSHTHTASAISDFDTQVRTNRVDQMAAPTSHMTW